MRRSPISARTTWADRHGLPRGLASPSWRPCRTLICRTFRPTSFARLSPRARAASARACSRKRLELFVFASIFTRSRSDANGICSGLSGVFVFGTLSLVLPRRNEFCLAYQAEWDVDWFAAGIIVMECPILMRLNSQTPVGMAADEIRIAEPAYRRGAVLLPA